MELKNRTDMDSTYQWDLSPIFADQKEWETAYTAAEQAVGQIASLAGTLGASPERQRRCAVSKNGRKGHESLCGNEHGLCLFRP
mgnify:CR=1 FL=1